MTTLLTLLNRDASLTQVCHDLVVPWSTIKPCDLQYANKTGPVANVDTVAVSTPLVNMVANFTVAYPKVG